MLRSEKKIITNVSGIKPNLSNLPYVQNIANLPAYILRRLKEWFCACVRACVCERGRERLPESNEKILSDFLFYSFPQEGSCHGMYWQMQICYAKKLPWRRQKTHSVCDKFANM